MEQTRRDIEAETRRAIQEIRREVADLTVMATEKVTRKTLTEDDQRRLVEDALSELDFSALAAERRDRREQPVDGRDRPGLRARAVRGRHRAATRSTVHEQLGEFADALSDNRELWPSSSRRTSRRGEEGRLERAVEGADPAFMNFLEALIERHRMPAIFRIRTRVRGALGRGAEAAAGAVTSAVELDEDDGQEPRRADRRAGRPSDRAHEPTSTPTSSAGSCCAWATHPRRLDQEPSRTTSQASRAGVAATPAQGAT